MKKSKITIHDIAKALDTTAATVSRALNNHPRISEETIRKVLDKAEELGYERNSMASSLRKGQSKIIGIIVPYADRIFFSAVIRGIEEEVKRHGYNVIICQSYEKIENEIDDVNALLSAQVAGIIISPSRETNTYAHLNKIINNGKTLVLFDRINSAVNASSVSIDDYQGAYDAVSHLITSGCQRIAFLSGNQSVSIFKERQRGYISALEENHISINNDLIVEVPSDVELGKVMTEKLMSLPNKPDAIFSSSDFSALGAVKWLIKNDYRVPEDVCVVGFGNDPFTRYLDPTMTSVDQKSKEMGKTAAQVFLEKLEGKSESNRKVLLTPELVVRESSMNAEVYSTQE